MTYEIKSFDVPGSCTVSMESLDVSRMLPGTFRVRGDTIDIFPAEHSELAVRLELFDDELETLQLFVSPCEREHKEKHANEKLECNLT